MGVVTEYEDIDPVGARLLALTADGTEMGFVPVASVTDRLTTLLSLPNGVASPAIGAARVAKTANAGATTLLDFTGAGVTQDLSLYVNDNFTSVGVSSNIITPTGGAIKLTAGRVYRFLRVSGKWYLDWKQEGRVSPNRGNAGATLDVGVDAAVQRWLSPLTNDRVITLAPTDLNGAAFDILRSLTATGDWDLIIMANSVELYRINLPALSVRVVYDGSAWFVLNVTSLYPVVSNPA